MLPPKFTLEGHYTDEFVVSRADFWPTPICFFARCLPVVTDEELVNNLHALWKRESAKLRHRPECQVELALLRHAYGKALELAKNKSANLNEMLAV